MTALQWEWDTTGLTGAKWRARLDGDRRNAWITPPDGDGLGDFWWSIQDNTRGQILDQGWSETLEGARVSAEYAAMIAPALQVNHTKGWCNDTRA